MPITDLTGYTWVGNSTITWAFIMQSSYLLSFTSNNKNFNQLTYSDSPDEVFLEYTTFPSPINAYDFITNQWTNDAYKTIQITGGTDATNSTLIAWLEANGTLTAPIQANTYNLTHTLTNLTKGNITLQITPDTNYTYPTSLTISNGTLTAPIQANTYNLTHTLTNLTKGNITLQITPDTNYTYPTSLTISNGTIVSYDNTTGVAVISGNDTTIVDGECVAQASGYNITISGVYEADVGSDLTSEIEIDGVRCEVDRDGTTTNIPHTFTNIVIQPYGVGAIYFGGSGDRYIKGYFKIISGTGTINSMETWEPIETITPNMELYTEFSDNRYIMPTSDLVIQLGYYED